jgi:hypothetical protein
MADKKILEMGLCGSGRHRSAGASDGHTLSALVKSEVGVISL